ncbi:HAMP domain-containing sensor histidine kinase [uncultured Clostridium sp.]|uniref:sensor histidine kinase n=1 Tax=uncultured Clostridium sp. TaxID=59620 RepID=UPI0027DBBF09|nr:HAMP domain-containing sensor histidine kinase [uncultured Clostridium sp.]
MIKFKGIGINLILGVLMGILFATMIMVEGYVILSSREMANGLVYEIAAKDLSIFKIIAVLVFMVTIILFNTRKIKSMNLNKIGIYLILSVIGALIAAIEFIALGMTCVVKFMPDVTSYVTENYLLAMNMIYIVVLLGIAVFLLVFTLFVNKKVKYIKFLSSEVKVIKDEDFGKTIEVRGQDELAELCSSINNMSLELREKIDNEKKIEQNKNELITNVSHDLRTPLTSILGYVDLLKQNGFEDKEKFVEYISIIDERSKSLNTLINELFEYTKLNSHDIKLNYSTVEIGSLVEQLSGEYSLIFKKEGLELISEIPEEDIFVDIDIQMIVRALENLLINAKKYSVRNSQVLVKLLQESNDIVISVENKVENISQDDLDNLFERFYKVDKARKTGDSTGLGLSIVKRVVELHKGLVKAELINGVIKFKIILLVQN